MRWHGAEAGGGGTELARNLPGVVCKSVACLERVVLFTERQ